MSEYHRVNGHSISQLTPHIVWVTKYRYPVLRGDIQMRCRSLIIQICESEDARILKGVVLKDHVHIECRPSKSVKWTYKTDEGKVFSEATN